MLTRIRVTEDHLTLQNGSYMTLNAVALAINDVLRPDYQAMAFVAELCVISRPSSKHGYGMWYLRMPPEVPALLSVCADGGGYPLEFDLEIPDFLLKGDGHDE
jgi:hypothetical protein